MIRLGIVVEGSTEKSFVDGVLAGHLQAHGVNVVGVPLHGNVTTQRIVDTMVRLAQSRYAASSLVDFYGFKGKKSLSIDALQEEITEGIKQRLGKRYNASKMLPYIQRHEFEALLFSDVSVFSRLADVSEKSVQELQRIRGQFTTPEDINDDKNTAPSKRIDKAIPSYSKVADGPSVAQSIGLHTMRAECPRFHQWVNALESLASPAPPAAPATQASA